MVESYMNHYPTGSIVSPERHHLKADMCPESLRQMRRGVLTVSQIEGDATLNCPSTCGEDFKGTDPPPHP